MEKRMDETMDAEKFLKELIHRALLGDEQAQQECTEKGLCCHVHFAEMNIQQLQMYKDMV